MKVRAQLLVVLGLFGLGCEPPPLSVLEPGFPKLEVWPPAREVVAVGERAFIDPTKVETIEAIQLVDGPPMKLEKRSLGKPKVLLPKQEGTYYPAKHALTDRRAMVHRVDEDKHGIVRKVHEAYLVDFEDGVVETFSGMSRFEQYSEAGVGIAWQMRDGVKWKVLVHGEDGLVVPLWPEEEGAPDLLIHPVWKQAWIFGVVVERRGWGRFPEREETRSVYIHWPDLRTPPPKGPKVKLPFRVSFSEREIITESGSVHGPDHKQQVDVPFVVSGERYGCSAAELNRDGSYDCRYGSYKTLADGWTFGMYDDEDGDSYFEARHRETGESQVLSLCGADSVVTSVVMDPPRVVLHFRRKTRSLVWSPDSTLEFPVMPAGEASWKSADGKLLTFFQRDEAEEKRTVGWLDLGKQVAVSVPLTSTDVLAGYPFHGSWSFTESLKPGLFRTARLGSNQLRGLSLKTSCRSLGFQDWIGDELILGCWRRGPNPDFVFGLDLDASARIVFPGAENRETLITETHVLSTRRAQTELVSWSRSPTWSSG